jgi:pimeloyl-ACP methyl ester carboxylesterase
VIAFNNAGVASSTGVVADTMEQMARDAIRFIDALGLDQVDLRGFSIGGAVVQEIALLRPDLVRRIILASAAPQGAPGMHGWAKDIIGAVGSLETGAPNLLHAFFKDPPTSRADGMDYLQRFMSRKEGRDAKTTWAVKCAQYDAVTRWGRPNHSLLERLAAIRHPVFVAKGDGDRMILPRYSYLLAGLLPDARIRIYPDSAHAFLYQHHREFAADIESFLADRLG